MTELIVALAIFCFLFSPLERLQAARARKQKVAEEKVIVGLCKDLQKR